MKRGETFVVDRQQNMASCMLRSALRQASFRCLRKKCVCPSSRTYASGEILHKAQNKYNVVALGNNNEQHTANCSPWAILGGF